MWSDECSEILERHNEIYHRQKYFFEVRENAFQKAAVSIAVSYGLIMMQKIHL